LSGARCGVNSVGYHIIAEVPVEWRLLGCCRVRLSGSNGRTAAERAAAETSAIRKLATGMIWRGWVERRPSGLPAIPLESGPTAYGQLQSGGWAPLNVWGGWNFAVPLLDAEMENADARQLAELNRQHRDCCWADYRQRDP